MAFQAPVSSVISLIDIGLKPTEHYVQFVPPATFGVIFDRATTKVHLVQTDGQKVVLRHLPDKIYSLRGFIGFRQRGNREMPLGDKVEDEIIRTIILTFVDIRNLRDAVEEYCPCELSANIIMKVWGKAVFGGEILSHGK
jgi:hypothetical protein